MLLSTDLKPNSDFTMVLNEVIFDPRLTHAEFRVWCQLLSLPKGSQAVNVEADSIAEQLGVAASVFRKHRQSLKDKGFLVGDRSRLVVTVPGEDFKPKDAKPTKEQQLRTDLREVWMKHKPDAYVGMKHPLSLNQVETLRLHAEQNGQTDLPRFLRAVLLGCKADKWWNEKDLNFTKVFGSGVPTEKKFGNVEKRYKDGVGAFDINDDQCWIEWYHSKDQDHMNKVVRLEMERYDAWDHQKAHAGDGVIYVYSHEGSLVHWTGKEGQYGLTYLPTAS